MNGEDLHIVEGACSIVSNQMNKVLDEVYLETLDEINITECEENISGELDVYFDMHECSNLDEINDYIETKFELLREQWRKDNFM